ncbi:vomeronasal type-2 receptor 26-like [Rhinophrynus dorsalis]
MIADPVYDLGYPLTIPPVDPVYDLGYPLTIPPVDPLYDLGYPLTILPVDPVGACSVSGRTDLNLPSPPSYWQPTTSSIVLKRRSPALPSLQASTCIYDREDPGMTAKDNLASLASVTFPFQLSFISQDPIQSDKQQFPYFYRTVPSEKTLYAAIIALLKHFGWMWIGIISSDDDASINALKYIKEMFVESGGCIDFIKIVPSINDYSPERIKDIQYTVEKSTANVILVYGSKNNVYYVEQNARITSIPGKVWIHTAENSFRMLNVANGTFVNGSLHIVMHKKEIPDYIKFVKEVNPARFPPGRTFTTWWDELCANRCPFNPRKRNCTGVESGRVIQYSHCNLRFTAMSYSVYNTVYIVAHALHELYQKTQNERLYDKNKLKFQDLKPWQLHNYLKKVNFTNTLGQEIYFNNDEIPNEYDIYNVVYMADSTIASVNVGNFTYNAPPGKQLIIQKEAIIWEKKFTETPRSVCSESCLPGYRKSVWEGKPVCCYGCMPCPEGEFSNETDKDVCTKCPEDQWPNKQKTACSPMSITFLSYEDPIGVVLTVIAIVFTFISAGVLGIFIKHQNTPIVKANNRDLSYLLLASLMFSFLCCLIFMGRPEQLTCFLQQAIFGITFTISVSSLLAKTFIVVVAFNATKPGNNLRKWVGAKIPKYIVFTSSVIQVLICFLWLVAAPPYSYYNKTSEPGTIIVECNEGSVIAFYTILGYLCMLASVCFIAAFLARKLPDTFNDAKLITFSMLVFFSVWIFFILTSHSAVGTSMVSVEVFAILASSSGLLGCMFAPKCYIILLKPERNRKDHIVKCSLGK